jgi:hypothetical protein
LLTRESDGGHARKGMVVKQSHTKYRLMGWNEVKRTITVEGPSGKCYVDQPGPYGLKFT